MIALQIILFIIKLYARNNSLKYLPWAPHKYSLHIVIGGCIMFENKLRLEGSIQGSISKKLLSHVADFGHSRSWVGSWWTEIIRSYMQLFSQHEDPPQYTTSVKFCQTGLSYKTAIQKLARVCLVVSLSDSLI